MGAALLAARTVSFRQILGRLGLPRSRHSLVGGRHHVPPGGRPFPYCRTRRL